MAVRFQNGFSLVEAIFVMVLIVVLAVSVIPRLIGTSNYSAEAYQTRLISVLRNIQIRAMQDTRDLGYCFQVNFDNINSAFGPPELDYSGAASDTCSGVINTSVNPEQFYATSSEMAEDGVLLLATNSAGSSIGYLRFDGMGLPAPDNGNCNSGCQVTLTAESVTRVCVESQGYVHAGSCY